MKTGWLIYKKQDALENQSYINWFKEEAKMQNIYLKLILKEDLLIGIDGINYLTLYKNQILDLPDFCVIRTIDATLQAHFAAQNVSCFNNYQTSIICNDKSASHIEIAQLGIPAVQTFHFDSYPQAPPLSYPFVLKAVNGRSGSEVFFIDNKSDFLNTEKKINNQNFIIQSADVQYGKDLRVFVIGKKIIAAVLRESTADFRANFKLGGTATLYHLNENESKLIKKIIHHFDFGLVGIDFLINNEGDLLFNEIEDVVGSRILSETTDINLLRKYITYIKSIL
ncbi:MAG TPA: ATP-grasp domain-containing protein [Pseudogracilibacillus sp.]|nr:ATP-grasp domain-containing protein [Pseudogracilibacillus sp.]